MHANISHLTGALAPGNKEILPIRRGPLGPCNERIFPNIGASGPVLLNYFSHQYGPLGPYNCANISALKGAHGPFYRAEICTILGPSGPNYMHTCANIFAHDWAFGPNNYACKCMC